MTGSGRRRKRREHAGIGARRGDTFVAGSAIFGSKDYRATISQMRDALKSVG